MLLVIFVLMHFMQVSGYLLVQRVAYAINKGAREIEVVNAYLAPLFLWLFGFLKKLQQYITMLPLVSGRLEMGQ